jgi:phage gp45-like
MENVIPNIMASLKPLASKLAGVVFRAIVEAVDDSAGVQVLRIAGVDGDDHDGIERLQNYGFTSVPPSGSEVIVVCQGGNRANMVVVVADSRESRKTGLAPGEVAMYSDGSYVLLKSGSEIEAEFSKFVLGVGASDPVARKSDLQSLANTFNAHAHTGAGANPPASPMVATGSSEVFVR